MSNKEIHPKFKLNGIHFNSVNELLVYSENELPDVYEFFSEWFSNKKYLTVHTSGSTGKPKAIKLFKEHMINSALATARYFDLDGDDISALLCMSPKFIAGKMMLVRAIVSGWNMDVIAPTSHPLTSRKMYDFVAMVPLQVYNSLDDIHKVKTVIVGGGAVSSDLQEKLKNVRPKVYSTYGMTETVTHIAVKKLSQLDGITNYYEVLPDITVEKDDRNCLVIHAPNISKDKIVTNDLVKLIDDKHFCWQGRFDNIINSGGVKIIPERVEEKLENSINQRFFISSKKDNALGQKVILIIEGKEIKNINYDALDKYEKPKKVFYINRFEETKSGKINRKATIEKIE
jgi:O-succinylbenzoic acid--CoA ligase